MKTPQYIFIHHTAVSYTKNPDQAEATDNYHKSQWNMISSLGFYGGYNYEISAAGKVTQFRADGEITAAQYQESMNDGRAISIALDGNFDIELPTDAQMTAIRELILAKMEQFDIPKENIKKHRDVAPKSCPGNKIPDDVYTFFCEEKKEIAMWAKTAAEKARRKGVIVDWENPQAFMTGEEIEFVFEKLGLVDPSKHQGGVSRERMAVTLDRLNLLK